MKTPFPIIALLVGLALADLEDLQKLQEKLPECSLGCLAEGASEHGCSVTDIACQCTKMEAMIKTVSPCLVKAGCELEDITNTAGVVAEICAEESVSGNTTQPVPTLGSVNEATGTAATVEATETGGAAARVMQGMGWTGAAVAALAAYLI